MTREIVVVEDSRLLGHMLSDALRAHGLAADVRVMPTASAFQNWLHAPRAAEPALVVLDIALPDGSGLELGRALRANEAQSGRPHVPVLFFSAQNEDETVRSGVADCFPARFVQKSSAAGPAVMALEAVRLIQGLFPARPG